MPLNLSQVTNEFVVRDADGSMKLWRNGELVPFGAERGALIEEAESYGVKNKSTDAAVGTVTRTPLREPVTERATRTEGANFYFSPLDEEEVDRFRKAASNAPQPVIPAETIAESIIDTSKLELDTEIRGRLVRVIASRLRDVRDLVSTKEVLRRSAEAGGIGLSEEEISRLLVVTEEFREKWEQGGMERAERLTTGRKDLSENIPQEQSNVADIFAGTGAPSLEEKTEGMEDEAGLRRVFATRPPIGKRMMSDVASPSRLVGPLDELQSMTLVEWRRFGQDSLTRTAKIREKIDVIAEDSLIDRAKGIQAWKRSPVYALYIALGRESMEEDQGIDAVIARRESKGELTLTREEFDAIADLNRSLQY